MQKLRVVKIGGNVVDSPELLASFLADFASMDGLKILVHGGGKIATKVSAALGIETQMVEGRRVTTQATVGVVTMVYCGGVNKSIVAQLHGLGCSAWGVCGADGGLISAVKRPVGAVDYGFVGDVVGVDCGGFGMLLGAGHSVVVAPITVDATGQLLNTNADTVASSVAVAMSERYDVELTYIFERPGVLMDIEDPGSVIGEIGAENFGELRAGGRIFEGMIPKIENALQAVQSGVGSVRISNTLEPGKGTTIR